MTDSAWWEDAKLLGVPLDESVMVHFGIVQATWNAESLAEELDD